MTSSRLSSLCNGRSFAPTIIHFDDACPFYLITAPPCRYARFASLALSTGGDNWVVSTAAVSSTLRRHGQTGRSRLF